MVRNCRAVAAALIVVASLQLVPARPAGALMDAYAGSCTGQASVAFNQTLNPTVPILVSASVGISSGSCTLVSKTNPLPHTVTLIVAGNVSSVGPTMSCTAGVMTGGMRFTIGGDVHDVTVAVVNVDGVLLMSGSSGILSVVGQVSRPANSCPVSGSWPATIVVEDPTVDGVIDGSF